jgi:cell division septation protein DedD
MIATRRLVRARHEFRFGARELVVIGAVFCLVTGLVFAGGILVGREMAKKGAARLDAGRESGRYDANGAGDEAPGKTAATRTEEKVTFYRTLTAPTPDLPQVGKPTIEERLVPKEEPVARATAPAADSVAPAVTPPAGDDAHSTAPATLERPAPPMPSPSTATASPASPTSKVAEPSRPPRVARVAKAPPARPAPAQLASAPGPAELPDTWTVQVSAFRSRALAEELRSRLAARGFDAYVFPSITEDGRPRYRVRVGTFASRSDAERAAGDLRSERGLNPLVTPRTTR